MKWFFVLMLSANTAFAEPWIDYDLLLEQNADKVVAQTAPDGSVTRILDMGGNVSITCTADGCMGVDMTESGAIGCTFAIMVDLQTVVRACPGVLSPERQTAFDQLYEKVGKFVAANAVPPRSWGVLTADLDGQMSAAMAEYTPEACVEAATEGSDIQQFFMMFTAPKTLTGFDAVLATPRLPVINPCL